MRTSMSVPNSVRLSIGFCDASHRSRADTEVGVTPGCSWWTQTRAPVVVSVPGAITARWCLTPGAAVSWSARGWLSWWRSRRAKTYIGGLLGFVQPSTAIKASDSLQRALRL